MKRSGSLLAGLGLSLGLIGPACTVDEKKHENTDVAGTLAVALVAQAGGNTYRLRNAIFTISGQSDLQLESEADPNSTELTAVLFPGNYNVLLEDGWAMERIDPAGDITVVQATLLDPNPIFAQVIPGSIANTRFRFTTNGQVVDFDLGSNPRHDRGRGSSARCRRPGVPAVRSTDRGDVRRPTAVAIRPTRAVCARGSSCPPAALRVTPACFSTAAARV